VLLTKVHRQVGARKDGGKKEKKPGSYTMLQGKTKKGRPVQEERKMAEGEWEPGGTV